jgi:plastocyanin
MIRLAAVAMLIGLMWLAPVGAALEFETITVHLSNFAFVPDRLRLRAGVPVRLHIVNDSSRGHNFSAPALFLLGSSFPDGAPPASGKVEVGPNGSENILLVPRAPGTYKLECTHFLHNLFSMAGSIVVE